VRCAAACQPCLQCQRDVAVCVVHACWAAEQQSMSISYDLRWQAEREARMERDARRAAGLPGVEPGAEDEDDDSDSEEILDLVPEVWIPFCFTSGKL
jgi:hypothetical protein